MCIGREGIQSNTAIPPVCVGGWLYVNMLLGDGVVGASLSEPHTSMTSLRCACVCALFGWILQLP